MMWERERGWKRLEKGPKKAILMVFRYIWSFWTILGPFRGFRKVPRGYIHRRTSFCLILGSLRKNSPLFPLLSSFSHQIVINGRLYILKPSLKDFLRVSFMFVRDTSKNYMEKIIHIWFVV